jgi:molybdopterin biosynthesis enzyme MoaB
MSLQVKKKKKNKKKAKKKNAIKIILPSDEETEDEEDDESGMYLEKEDMLLLYKALKNYKPVNDDEEMTHEMLVEQFEEVLVVDYKVKLPGVRW